MEKHPYGKCLYQWNQATSMPLGSLGYLNDNGDWNQVVTLDDPDDLKKQGFSEPDRRIFLEAMQPMSE